ncbi:MAG: hypothetical protein U5K74_02040 [Gemmatimonadaceae bacterium]|nr:hypothetical protein [Gemmatimonadaceae bacterium]
MRQGAANLAAGDLFGSSMANMLILAVLGLVPPRDEIFRRASLDLTLSAALAITLNAIAALLILTGSRSVIAGISPGAMLLLVIFIVGSHVIYRQQHAEIDPRSASSTAAVVATTPPHILRNAVLRFAGASVVVLLIAPVFASNAQQIAIQSGLGSTFFGTLFVGAATSLPEIVTCIAAVRLGAFDLAVGNLFGSNVFNMTIFLAMNLAAPGTSIFASLDRSHVLSALIAMILMALGIASIVFRAKRRFAIVEPGSVLMVIVYVVGVVSLYRTHVAR